MESFEQLVDQYTPMIHKIIQSLHIYKNHDDFFQTGLISLWEATLVYDETRGNFGAIAYKYMKGRMLQELNTETKLEESFIFPKGEYWETIEDHKIDASCEKGILLSYCKGCELTENQTKWVLYTFLEGLSISEIAAREKASPSTVKQWRKGAKARIAKCRCQC